MSLELVSTARMLRLAGFPTPSVGGVMISLGSLMTWATVPPFDTPTRGTDLWEGIITLAIGVAVLVGMVTIRLMATKLKLPCEEVGSRLAAVYDELFHVALQPGNPRGGRRGLVTASGGLLSIAWAARAPTRRAEPRPVTSGDRLGS